MDNSPGGGEGGGGGELPYKNYKTAGLKFLKSTRKDIRILFDGRGSNDFFYPSKGTNAKTTLVIFCHIFSAQYPKKVP